MAEDQTDEQPDELEEGEVKKGGLLKWIVVGVLAIGLGVGGWFAYPLVMGSEPEADAEMAEDEPEDKPALFAPLAPPLVLNFTDQYGDAHFMQMTLEVMSRDPAVIDHVRNHAAVIRSQLILLFSDLTYEAVVTRDGKEAMLDDALGEIRAIVKRETGETGVEAVYFTGLVIQ